MRQETLVSETLVDEEIISTSVTSNNDRFIASVLKDGKLEDACGHHGNCMDTFLINL